MSGIDSSICTKDRFAANCEHRNASQTESHDVHQLLETSFPDGLVLQLNRSCMLRQIRLLEKDE